MSDADEPGSQESPEGRPVPRPSRRAVLKTGASVAGVGAVAGAGFWYGTRPTVAATVDTAGANNVVFDTSQEVVSVAEVLLAPEITIAYDGFSKGVDEATLSFRARVTPNQDNSSAEGTYTGDTADAWENPTNSTVGSTDTVQVTISDTVQTDGTEQAFTFDVEDGSSPATGSVRVQTPDLTDQMERNLGDGENFLIGWDANHPDTDSDADDPLPLQTAIEQSADLSSGEGLEMFPQSIDADTYGVSLVDLDYTITLHNDDGDQASVSSQNLTTGNDPDTGNLSHRFDVAVENQGGKVTDADADSNTGADGENGTTDSGSMTSDLIGYGSKDQNVYFHSTQDWSVEQTLSEATMQVNSVTWAPSGDYVGYGAEDGNAYIHASDWSLDNTLTRANDAVFVVEWSPSGDRIAYASKDYNVYVHTSPDWSHQNTLTEAGHKVFGLSWAPSGDYIAYGSVDKNVYVHATADWSLVDTLSQASGFVRPVAWSPSGDYIAYGDYDHKVSVHQTSDWSHQQTLQQATNSVFGLSWSPAESYLSYSSQDDNVYVHSTADWSHQKTLTEATGGVHEVEWSLSGDLIAYASNDTQLYVHSIDDWSLTETLTQAENEARTVDWSP